MDRKEFGLVQMIDGIHLSTAGGYAEGGALDDLKFLD